MSRAIFIEGEHVNLVPLTVDDAEACFEWVNDMAIIVNAGNEPLPAGLHKQREFIRELYGRKNSLILGIQRRADGSLIGTGGLSRIEWVNQRAELTLCIGEVDQQGMGYGTEATMLILDHAFGKLNLHSVMLRVIDYNAAALACYRKCGFKPIGRRREAKIIDNQRFDVIYMDILASEWTGDGNKGIGNRQWAIGLPGERGDCV